MFEKKIPLTEIQKLAIAGTLVLLILAGRNLPHLWNMTPVVATALFAGVYLGKRYALLVPLLGMFLGDISIGFYDWKLLTVVYGSFAVIGILGVLLKKRLSLTTLTMVSFVASTGFFLTTNAAVWVFSPWYEKSFTGLMEAYTLGIPFYKNALVGDFFYTMAFFGVYAFFAHRYARRMEVRDGNAQCSAVN